MSIVPGQDEGPRKEPLLADEPLPPGVEDWSDDVDAIEKRIRERGPDEVQKADEQADAVEGDGGHDEGDGGSDEPGSASDAANDPTSDEGADPEDPEAQRGDEPASGSGE